MSDGECELYHYRDREQREIDFLIERDDGALLGVEIKAAASAKKSDFKHLTWFRDNLVGKRPTTIYSPQLSCDFLPNSRLLSDFHERAPFDGKRLRHCHSGSFFLNGLEVNKELKR